MMRWVMVAFLTASGALASTEVNLYPDTTPSSGLPLSGGTMTGDVRLNDDVQIEFGSSGDALCEYDTAQTPDALVCQPGTDSRTMIIGPPGTDYAKAQQTNWTLCVHSADTATAADLICLAHDQTDGVISTDAGDLLLDPAGGDVVVDGAIRVADGSFSAPSLSFSNDSSSGFFASGAGDMRMSVFGSQRAAFSTTQGHLNFPSVLLQGLIRMPSTTITLAAAATTFAASRGVHAIDCDAGGNTIGTITGGTGNGLVLTLIFVDGSCTITDTDDGGSNTIDLDETDAGAGNIVSADDMVLQLIYDGTLWRQSARVSAN